MDKTRNVGQSQDGMMCKGVGVLPPKGQKHTKMQCPYKATTNTR